ncbi:MAG: acyl-CoA thioesterase II [Alphaproteobacteria bacterium]|nr:acyl-CoA thioesterase II [Alphaproteobacteria bacterium]
MAAANQEPKQPVEGLLKLLDLETLEENLFRGVSPDIGWQRVYGGQVLGQALVAASRTVPSPRTAHSLHAYFLIGGDPTIPIVYDVERTRDGGSFTNRHVKAQQHGNTIFSMSVSFHGNEESFNHQAKMPDVPPPEELPSAAVLMEKFIDKLPEGMQKYWKKKHPVDMRPVDVSRYMNREKHAPAQNVWLRANGTLPDDQSLHHCVLAYASDFTLLDTALIAHGKLMFDNDIQLASLDHALWFHRPFRVDDWLLYSQESPNAHGARGFCRGQVFARDGQLVASVTQEGLVRKRDTAFVLK